MLRVFWSAVAVAAFPETEPAIVEEKVFTPAKVWFPVVTAPETVPLAVGSVTLLPVEELIVGPAVVPPVMLRLVPTLTCAPAAMPSSLVLSPVAIKPALLVLATGTDTLLPVLEVIVRELPEPPIARFVPTLTCAPAAIPSSLVLSADPFHQPKMA